MRCSIAIACGLGLVAGCGRLDFDPLGDGGGGGTGARIVPLWNVFPDGTRLQVGEYDTVLHAECAPAQLDATTNVCLPAGGAVVYGDAACTTLVGDVEGAPDTTFLHSPLGSPVMLYQRGAPIAQTTYYTMLRPGFCQGPYTSSQLVAVGPAFDASQLASLQIVTEPTGGRLQPRSYAATDGLHIPIDAYDTVLATHCQRATVTVRGYACTPDENVESATLASDPGCTDLFGVVSAGSTPPVFATYTPATGCQYEDNVYTTVGAKIAQPPQVYTTVEPPSCLTTTFQDPFDLYPVGSPVSLSPITHATNINGGGRFQLGEYRGDGVTFADPIVYDSSLADTCTPGTASDGVLRCLPAGVNLLALYGDASCTTPISVGITLTGNGCTPVPAPLYVLDGSAGTTIVYAAGALHSGAVYEDPGGCIPLGFGSGTVTAYDVGPAVDPTTFAALTVTWGP